MNHIEQIKDALVAGRHVHYEVQVVQDWPNVIVYKETFDDVNEALDAIAHRLIINTEDQWVRADIYYQGPLCPRVHNVVLHNKFLPQDLLLIQWYLHAEPS